MMETKFTEDDIKHIRDIIEQYRNVSGELAMYQVKADEIQTKVIELEATLKEIKETEDRMMEELHKKYGEFTLQDIYEQLLMDELFK